MYFDYPGLVRDMSNYINNLQAVRDKEPYYHGINMIAQICHNGQYEDHEIGLVYLRNRYYDLSIGRVITEDSANDGLNWYVYSLN